MVLAVCLALPTVAGHALKLRGTKEKPALIFEFDFPKYGVTKKYIITLFCDAGSEGKRTVTLLYSKPTLTEFIDHNVTYTEDYSGFISGKTSLEVRSGTDRAWIVDKGSFIMEGTEDDLLWSLLHADAEQMNLLFHLMTTPSFKMSFLRNADTDFSSMPILSTPLLEFDATSEEMSDQAYFRVLCNRN